MRRDDRPAPRKKSSFIADRVRHLHALLLREVALQGEGPLGYFKTILEPLALIIGLSVIRYELHPIPPLGPSIPLFFLNGVVVFYAFNKVEAAVSSTFSKNRNLMNFPVLSVFEMYVSKLLLHVFTMLLIYHIFLFSHNFFLKNWLPNQIMWPEDILRVYEAVLMAGVYGFFIGILNLGIEVYFPPWAKLYSFVRRAQLLLSGKMFVVDFMPTTVREVMYWNPLMHAIELGRSGFYPYYESQTMDLQFFYSSLLLVAVVGLSLEYYARQRLEVES